MPIRTGSLVIEKIGTHNEKINVIGEVVVVTLVARRQNDGYVNVR